MTTYVFVGSYTHRSPVGIHVFAIARDGGDPELRHRSELVEHASFVTPSPDGRTLFAVSESHDDGAVVSMRVDASDGSLTEIDRVASHGGAPCHVSVDPDGRHLYVANYASGTVAAYALEPDGRFGELVASHHHHGTGPHPRQDGPHAHSVTVDRPTGRVYAADLGTDRIMTYEHLGSPPTNRWIAIGDTAVRPGAGPRHLAFHPVLPLAFVVGELDSTLLTLRLDRSSGALEPRHTVATLPAEFAGTSIGADVHVHPDGRHVHVSNRGHDSIATFQIGAGEIGAAGEPLVPLGHVPTGGRTPRNFSVHPSGRSLLVANQDSDSIVELAIDPTTGCPQPGRQIAEVPEPVCIAFAEVRA
jgi:6-phosphogluconolactonase